MQFVRWIQSESAVLQAIRLGNRSNLAMVRHSGKTTVKRRRTRQTTFIYAQVDKAKNNKKKFL
jgi:hypothetical protein